MKFQNNILMADDDKNICELIRLYLEKEGYGVCCVYDGKAAVDAVATGDFSLVVLDIMMPVLDGMEALKEIRRNSKIPIIMLTAKGETIDKVLGLELGADDYMTKPFSLRELMARVKANLRRTQLATKNNEESKILEFADLVIDTEKYEVRKRNKVIDLTFREFELLKYLATKRGKIFTREILLNKVWDYEFYGDVRTVDVTIRRLREKIEDNPSVPAYIMTKRGVGYYFGA